MESNRKRLKGGGMDETWIVGAIATTALLMPVIVKGVSRRLNRRLARKLARGPVGALMRYDYDYAMALSRDVFTGELSVEQAAQIADRFLRCAVGDPRAKALPGMIIHTEPSKGACNGPH
jgi:hypothetical protein